MCRRMTQKCTSGKKVLFQPCGECLFLILCTWLLCLTICIVINFIHLLHSFSLKMGQALTILQVLTFAVRKGREISDQLNRAAENRVKLKKCSLHRRIHYNCYLPLGTATDSSELPMQYHSSHKYISFSVKPDSY